MISEPKVETYEAEPYVAIRKTVAMLEIPNELPQLISEVFMWMTQNKIEGNGAPFFRYLSRDEDNILVVDVGVPTKITATGNERITAGKFPDGPYATLTYTGPYQNLRQAHMALDEWVVQNNYKENGIIEDGIFAGCRIEFYVSDPVAEPNPENWVTEIKMLIEKV